MGKLFGFGKYQYELVASWAKFSQEGVFSDIAIDSQGKAYVAFRDAPYPEVKSGSILVFDSGGNFLTSWGEGLFTTPHGIWISDEDEIYFADCNDHTVRKYSTSGELLMTIGMKGQPGAPGVPFNRPCRAVVSKSGDIYIGDGYGQNRIHRLSPEGDIICSWGETGDGPGQFQLPHHVTVDRNDRVYVMDRRNNRCQVFNTEGKYLDEWSNIFTPQDAVIDGEGVMHIAEGGGEGGKKYPPGILLMTLSGEVIGRWGERGMEPGQFSGSPHGIWIDGQGDLYVAQVGVHNSLNKYART